MKKIEKFLFYLFIFSIPFQTRKVLFSFFTEDRFVEWNSGFLYFTDLLLIGILILWIRRVIREKSKIFQKFDLLLFGFFVIAGLSLITSQNNELSIYQLIRLAELILLFLYVKYNFDFFRIEKILKLFVFSGVFQALIAIGQFFKQSSLGLRHFEAGIYNPNIPGVATFFVDGIKFIRAYGTAPHPNVLAVFLLFSIFCLYGLFLTGKKSRVFNMLYVICYMLLSLGLLVTFSRAIILVFIVGSLIFFIISFFRLEKSLKIRIISIFSLFLVSSMLYTGLFWSQVSARFLAISPEEQAITLRVYYNDIALSVIKEKPFLGLGLGNFIFYLLNNFKFKEFWLYQPVHNLYLLIASEIGILGLVVFLIFIGFNIWKSDFLRKSDFCQLVFLFLVSCFLFLGLIDHYFWTIQQSRFLFWVVLGIIGGLNLMGPHSLMDKTFPSGGKE